ncbi:hypothetical protein Vadar_027975 [Vaccinium darrowii]|uniref:Uncharacterized protein n=1 Tax=Vaccinium darrowii TaxID=229202 RepID=A0ACB7ZGY1_9ERIC|nr:hypothetical protein Vadar_027975 [Vaccinium darrowii]
MNPPTTNSKPDERYRRCVDHCETPPLPYEDAIPPPAASTCTGRGRSRTAHLLLARWWWWPMMVIAGVRPSVSRSLVVVADDGDRRPFASSSSHRSLDGWCSTDEDGPDAAVILSIAGSVAAAAAGNTVGRALLQTLQHLLRRLVMDTNQLDDIKHFGDACSLDDKVESFLSNERSKGFSFGEVSSIRTRNKITCCQFSSDGKLLASAGHDKKVAYAVELITASENHILPS